MAAQPNILVCVGATKSGTSWLYQHLHAHPECHFRSIKELHYFDMVRPEHVTQERARLQGQMASLRERLATATPSTGPGLALRLADLTEWETLLARGPVDLAAYRAFLMDGWRGERVVGDVTPGYAVLTKPRLRKITGLGAGLKVVFLMRDPLARTWSHIRMVATRAGAGFEARARALLGQIAAGDLTGDAKRIADRGDYRSILPKLTAVFAPGTLHLEFFETLLTEGGLARLWAFLGIGPGPAALDKPIWESPKLEMTGAEAGALRRWLAPQYDFVSGLLPQLPQAWRVNMEERLA